jgi:hypothetical protein
VEYAVQDRQQKIRKSIVTRCQVNIPCKIKAVGVVADNSGMTNAIAQSAAAPAAEPLPGGRRRENRIRVNIPARIIYQGLLHGVSANAVCTDISEAGISFQTSDGLYVGEIVEVEFRDQIAAPFRFLVRVLYKMGHRYGAYFMEPGCSSNKS